MGVDRRPTPPFSWVRWEWIFFANVFMACVSFSIVLPSLWLYLSALDGSQEFYAWVVAAFSIGEAIGSTHGPPCLQSDRGECSELGA